MELGEDSCLEALIWSLIEIGKFWHGIDGFDTGVSEFGFWFVMCENRFGSFMPVSNKFNKLLFGTTAVVFVVGLSSLETGRESDNGTIWFGKIVCNFLLRLGWFGSIFGLQVPGTWGSMAIWFGVCIIWFVVGLSNFETGRERGVWTLLTFFGIVCKWFSTL